MYASWTIMAASTQGKCWPAQHNVDLNLFNLTPELLDQPTLLCILESRCIQAPNMKSMTKEQLLALFMRMVPLPQRRTRKGKNVAEQNDPEEEVLHSINCISIGFNKTAKLQTGLHTINKRLTPAGERLKPPPDVINYGRKKITLNRPSSSKSNGGQDLDKIIIKDRTKTHKKLAETSAIAGTKRLKTDGSQDLDKIIIKDRTKTEKNLSETSGSAGAKCLRTGSEEAKIPNKISPKPSSCAEDKLSKLPSKRVKLKRSSNINTEPGASDSTSDFESKRQKVILP